MPASSLLCPLLTSAGRSARISPPSVLVLLDNQQISQGTTQNVPRVDAGFIKHTPCGWRTSRSRARSSRVCHTSYPVPVRRPARLDWASSRPHLTVDALALLLAFGSAHTWHEDLHLARSVPCLAHTLSISGGAQRRPLHAVVRRLSATSHREYAPPSGLYVPHVLIGKSAARVLGQAR